MHWAAKRGHTECLNLLLDWRAEINCRDLMGKTAVYYAFMLKNTDALHVGLIENRHYSRITHQ